MDNIIVILIVGGALIYCVRRIFIKKKCPDSCPCGPSCGVSCDPDRLDAFKTDAPGDDPSDELKK